MVAVWVQIISENEDRSFRIPSMAEMKMNFETVFNLYRNIRLQLSASGSSFLFKRDKYSLKPSFLATQASDFVLNRFISPFATDLEKILMRKLIIEIITSVQGLAK